MRGRWHLVRVFLAAFLVGGIAALTVVWAVRL